MSVASCSRFVLHPLPAPNTSALISAQRLRNAYDQVVEEQARQRPLQQSPSRRSTTSQRVNQTGSPARRSSQRPLNRAKDNAQDLSGPDPDPTTFEAEKVSDGEEKYEPAPPLVPQKDEMNDEKEAEVNAGEAKEAQTAQEGNEATKEEENEDIPEQELPMDVRSKLRKLSKLEEKYQRMSSLKHLT